MRHIVRAGAHVVSVARTPSGIEDGVTYVKLAIDDVKQTLMLPVEAIELAQRLRGVADAITEEERRRAAADPRQMSLPLLTLEKNG